MAFRDLRDFVAALEQRDELRRVSREVDRDLEIGEIMWELHQTRGPAALFEHVKDSDYPLLAGAMGTIERYAMALGLPTDQRASSRR